MPNRSLSISKEECEEIERLLEQFTILERERVMENNNNVPVTPNSENGNNVVVGNSLGVIRPAESPSSQTSVTSSSNTPSTESLSSSTSTLSNSVDSTSASAVESNSNQQTNLADILNAYTKTRDDEVHQKNQELERQKKAIGKYGFRRDLVPPEIVEQVKQLPIHAMKNKIIEFIKKNQVVIIVGETGSGKSTQIPQFIVEAGMVKPKTMIGITQPRRVAAKSLAERVSDECGVKLGSSIGYAVRFDNCLSSKTVIKYMTDGLMVKEFVQDEQGSPLQEYSVIMVDEAHERSVHTDVCFGLLKRIAKTRRDIKIIISSATLELDKLSRFFNNAPVLSLDGKCFDVGVIYEPCLRKGDYADAVMLRILKIQYDDIDATNGILVFLTGQEEIEEIEIRLLEHVCKLKLKMVVIPCHSSLPFEEQQQMFKKSPVGFRKVVLATNIAETSVTIDGISYVIDCGFVKENRYNPQTKIQSLVKIPITQFQAIQRNGRAGRTKPGHCYRLYSEEEYNDFVKTQEPEIRRSNIDSVVLDLYVMGIQNPLEFEFMDAPNRVTFFESLISLRELGALDEGCKITHLGRQMAGFPLDPPLAKMLLTSVQLGCSAEMVKAVAVLSTQYQHLFFNNKKVRAEARKKKEKFNEAEGDLLTLLRVYNEWKGKKRNEEKEKWCKENFIQLKYLNEALEIEFQLWDIMKQHKLLTSKGFDHHPCQPQKMKENLCKSFTAGYFFQLAKRSRFGQSYDKLNSSGERQEVNLHPSSSVFQMKPLPEWIVFHQVMETSKPYIKGAVVIKPEWITEFAPEFAKIVAKKCKVSFAAKV